MINVKVFGAQNIYMKFEFQQFQVSAVSLFFYFVYYIQ
jgi:hypothetical protein